MQKALLIRHDYSNQGIFGQFFFGGKYVYSGELPDRGNESSYSSIPEGIFTAAFTLSPRFDRCLYLVGPVPKRTGIRIHPANLMGDSKLGFKCQLNGCIALGERLGWIDGQKAVLLSQPAVRRVEQYFGGRSFELEIRH